MLIHVRDSHSHEQLTHASHVVHHLLDDINWLKYTQPPLRCITRYIVPSPYLFYEARIYPLYSNRLRTSVQIASRRFWRHTSSLRLLQVLRTSGRRKNRIPGFRILTTALRRNSIGLRGQRNGRKRNRPFDLQQKI